MTPAVFHTPTLAGLEVAARALRCVRLEPPAKYRNGAGNADPKAPTPLDAKGECDCSSFADWALGIWKHERGSDVWYNTDAIEHDALTAGGLWDRLFAPAIGCVVVYGAGAAVGHCAIVVAVPDGWQGSADDWRALEVVDCSSGNYRRTGNAIQRRSGGFFRQNGGIFAWYRPLDSR